MILTDFFKELYSLPDFVKLYTEEQRQFQGDVSAPDNYALSVAKNIVHIYGGVSYRITFIDSNGSVQHDGGPLRYVFSVSDMTQNKHLFYFSITGTYSSWDSTYFDPPEDWGIVKPVVYTTHLWVPNDE